MTEEEFLRLQTKYGNADIHPPMAAAGNMDDSTFAAAEAKFGPVEIAKPAPEPEPASTVENIRHGLGGGPLGAADVADMPYNVAQGVKMGADALPPGLRQTMRSISPVTAGALSLFTNAADREGAISEKPGYKELKAATAPEFENVHPAAEFTRKALEWGVGGLPKLATKAFRKALPDVIAGLSAAGGNLVGEQISENGGTTGELVGGLTGVIIALKTGKTAGLDKNSRLMLEAIEEQFDDPAAAVTAIRKRVQDGEIGSLADLSREMGVADVESFLSRVAPFARRNQAKLMQRRIDQIYDEVTTPLSGGEARRAPYAAGRQRDVEVRQVVQETDRSKAAVDAAEAEQLQALSSQRTAAEQAARTADEQATAATQADAAARQTADTGLRPDQHSAAAAGKYTAAEKTHADEVTKPLWTAFDDGGDIATPKIKAGVTTYVAELDPAEAAILQETYGRHLTALTEMGDTVSPRGISLRIQMMKDDINKAFAKNEGGWAEKKLDEIVKGLETTLADPTVSRQYSEAVAATKEGYDRFGPGYIGDVRRSAEPETLLSAAGLTGDKGAATSRLMAEAGIPGLPEDVGKYIQSQAVRAANPETVLAKYEAVLDSLDPTVRQNIVDMVQAKAGKKTALTQATAAEKAADKTAASTTREGKGLSQAAQKQRDTLDAAARRRETGLTTDSRGRYADKPNTEIDRLLNDPDGVDEMKMLLDDMVDLDEVASFKAHINERLENMLFNKVTDPGTGAVTYREPARDAYERFIRMRDTLVDAEILDPADAKRIEAAVERGSSTNRLRNAAKAQDITQRSKEHINLLASGGAAAFLGPLPGAYSLMVGGAVRRSLKTLLGTKMTAKRLVVLDEYLNNPKKYLADLDKLGSAAEIEREFLTRLVGAGQAAEILGAE